MISKGVRLQRVIRTYCEAGGEAEAGAGRAKEWKIFIVFLTELS